MRRSGAFFVHRLHAPFGYVVTYCIFGVRTKKGEPDFKILWKRTHLNKYPRTNNGKRQIYAYAASKYMYWFYAVASYLPNPFYNTSLWTQFITFFCFCQCFLGDFSNFGVLHYENVCEFFRFSQMRKNGNIFTLQWNFIVQNAEKVPKRKITNGKISRKFSTFMIWFRWQIQTYKKCCML